MMAFQRSTAPIPLQASEEGTEQHCRLSEVVRLLRKAGYQSIRIERDLYRLGERLITVSTPDCRSTRFDVHCRLVDGAWQYEAICGKVLATSATSLLDLLNHIFAVRERSERF